MKSKFGRVIPMIVTLMFCGALILSACASPTQTAAPPATQAASGSGNQTGGEVSGSGDIHIGYASETFSNPFWNTIRTHATAAAEEKGVKLTMLGSEDIAEQVRNAEDLIEQKVDVLVLTPWDAQGIIPVVEKANAAGIPVITVDQTSAGGKVETYIATDNILGGKLAAQWLAESLGGKGKVAILEGKPGSTTNNDRLDGFNQVIKNYPGIEIVASVTANWRRDQGLDVMGDILNGNPQLDGVMALNDEMALGAMEAIKAAGREGEILLAGYNGADEAIQQVYQGNLDADVLQYPEQMGRLLVEWGVAILNGETPPARINPGVGIVDSTSLQKSAKAVKGGGASEPPAGAASSGDIHIGYASETFSNPFWNTIRTHATAAAEEKGVKLTMLGSEDIAEQVRNAEDLIEQKVDVLVLTPWDAQGIIPVVEKANAAGIPVITVDQTSAGGKVETYIATDNILGGKLAAQWLAESLGGKGKVAILEGKPGSTTNNDRLDGFNQVIKNYPGIEIVASVTANWRRDQGLDVMGDILNGNPQLDGVMALNDEMALGAMEAIKAAGREGEILLAGYNGADEAIQQVYQGNLDADVLQYPEQMGRLLVEWGVAILNGETPPARINPGVGIVDSTSLQKSILAIEGIE